MAGLVLTGAVLHYTGWAQRGWHRLKARRAERFTNEGYQAWQSGRYREAEILFASAAQTDPGARRARLLLGRMLLQTRRLPEARQIFGDLLATEKGEQRLDTASLYFEALLGTAAFEELGRFCLAELPGLPPTLRSQWGAVVVEVARLTRQLPSPIAAAGPGPGDASNALDVLLAAQQCLNAGRRELALAWLARLDGHQLEGSLQSSAVRLVRELQGIDRARLLLNTVGRVLDESELAFNELWLAALGGPATGGVINPALVATALPPPLPPRLVLQRLGRLLLCADAELPRLLAARFEPDAAGLTDEQLAALWLMWELDRAGQRDNPWSRRLSERVRFTVLAREPGDFTLRQLIAIVNSLPLSRDTVVGLLTRLPAAPPQ